MEQSEATTTTIEETTQLDERSQMLAAARSIPQFHVLMAREHPLRILLAEDSLVNIKIALWFLRKLGYHADVAFNGIEALDAMRHRTYDAVLMDAEMPEMDGRQAAMLIRKEIPQDHQPQIIAMTANARPGDREEFLSLGMDDYITKPLKIEDLIRALEACEPMPNATEEEIQKYIESQSIKKVA